MKHLLSVLFFLPVAVMAQDTCGLKKQKDAFTKQEKITTGFISFAGSGAQLNISMEATATEIDFFFWFKNEGKCFDDQSQVTMNYEGEKVKTNFKNTGSMNCDGAFHVTFRNNENPPSNLKRLMDKRIASFKFIATDKKATEIMLTEEQRHQFQKMVSCMLRDAPGLRK